MFAIIILTGSTTTIVNYEDKVINKYESWNKQLEKKEKQLEKREKDCNVIISDYLRKNYKYKRCFYSTNHVSNFVLLELLERALKYLEIDADDFKLSKTWENDGREIPIYPSVQKILQLDFYKERYCYFKLVKEEPSSLEEYVDDYIKYCKPVWEAKNSKEIF